jgi:hypothetical protein
LKTNKNRKTDLNQISKAIALKGKVSLLYENSHSSRSLRNTTNDSGKKAKKKCLRSRFLGTTTGKSRKLFRFDDIVTRFPNFGEPSPELKRIKSFSKEQLLENRLKLERIYLQSKKDFEKLHVIQCMLVGSVIRTNRIGILSLPYVSIHPRGWVCIIALPSFRAAKELLSQMVNCYSSLLGKTQDIQSRFESLDSERTIVRTIYELRNSCLHQ